MRGKNSAKKAKVKAMPSDNIASAYVHDLKLLIKMCQEEAVREIESMREASARNDLDAFARHNELASKSIAESMAYCKARDLFLLHASEEECDG